MIDHRSFLRNRTGASAVEFAFVAPVFLLILFGLVCFGILLGAMHGVQQLVAEAARASVAGLSDGERDKLARASIARNVGSYPFIDAKKLLVTTVAGGASGTAFEITATYDFSASPIFQLGALVPLPDPTIRRSAVVEYGGLL
ncbi:MAG: hypothetical protein JWL93_1526 [Hyphomicrobiales bacterium]|nr:hypothetical protein [Hyphomicrobiales bacterium]